MSRFFGEHGDRIKFYDSNDLTIKLSQLDCTVPGRTKGRTSAHRERYCLKLYLLHQAKLRLLKFPLRVTKTEAPDFIISNAQNLRTGLEITEAGTEEYQRAMTELEKSPVGTVLESGTNKLVKKGERLIGEGWNGDSVEREWVPVIIRAIVNKFSSLNKQHFQLAEINELLIYDNSHLAVMLDFNKALSFLRANILEVVTDVNFKKKFHIISIIHSQDYLGIISLGDKANGKNKI